MKGFLVLCLVSAVVCSPQGYNNYQYPSPSQLFNRPQASPVQPQSQYYQPAPVAAFGNQYQQPNRQYLPSAEPFQLSQTFQPTSQIQQPLLPSPYQLAPPAPSVPAAFQGNPAQQAGYNNYQNFGSVAPQFQTQSQPGSVPIAPTISKHYYFHAAPENEFNDDDGAGSLPQRKNYRVVFIRAPSTSPSAAALQNARNQQEEKTVIYVLSQKTDQSDLQNELAKVQGVAQKPEVFFIKYKTPEEAQHAQHTIQAQYDQLGGTSQISDEGVAPVQSFVGSLDARPQNQGQVFQQGQQFGQQAASSVTAGNNNQYLPPV